MSNLLTKHRPADWADMVGDPNMIADLEQAAAKDDLRAFLLWGPSGVGKTTAARLIAKTRGVSGPDLIEVDAASRSGVGDVRQLTELTRTRGLNGGGKRCIIVDECHRLSAQAWDALLKTIEDAPDWVTFVFCTTERAKVPKTVMTRCGAFGLYPVDRNRLGVLLQRVTQSEGITITGKVASAIVDKADGSPRAMLAALATLSGDDEEAQLRSLDTWVQKSTEAIELARMLVSGKSEKVCLKALSAINLKETGPEAIRQIVLRYASSAALKGNPQAVNTLAAFKNPFLQDYPLAYLIVAISDSCI